MYAALKNRLIDWFYQPRSASDAGIVVLGQRRVYILPTAQGLTFAAVLLLMLTGSINYNLSLGFVLTFLLGALGINAMIYTFRNLANLRVSAGRARPVYAGDTAHFSVNLESTGANERYAVGLTRDRSDASFVDVPRRSTAVVTLGLPAPRRGILRPGRLTLFTRYPLGLFYAWSYIDLDLHCVVYPRPARPALPLPPAATSTGEGARQGMGQEDFSGLRQYHHGDSPRHIAWKVAARDQGLMTKQFTGRADAELWLAWDQLPPRMALEEKLSHLARWVLDAHAAGLSFGVRLPGTSVELAAGEAQRDRCLEALARYEPPGAPS